MKSIFFWSEEHAREYRRSAAGERGVYMTLPQSIYVTRKTQSVLFGFELEEE